MSNCGAGNCSCECGGNKGCGCIASSDFPDQCECHCYGAAFGGGLTLGLNAYVDVSISGLPLLDAADSSIPFTPGVFWSQLTF